MAETFAHFRSVHYHPISQSVAEACCHIGQKEGEGAPNGEERDHVLLH